MILISVAEKPSKEKTLKNVYENSVPSTSRESRDIAMVVYTENNSSDMEEPYSPVVSEYLPSHHTSRSSSLVRELCSPLPSSLIHDMINSPQNDSESTFKFDSPLKMHSIVDFIASPLIIYKNINIIKNSKELADDSDITSQVNYYSRIEGVKPLSPSIDISSSSIEENSLNLKNLPQPRRYPIIFICYKY
ncbi:unnamed protein product [Parnassius apollo]|uniref:(apollo) hypothetical protein n=1 Tax=Parnassius apollo TaxID=110799 RepID=A0A8S3X998_PARAO|nr:unnamed protein product [Parnassius apollo]